MNDDTRAGGDQPASRWRLRLGALLFSLGMGAPALIPVVAASRLSAQWKALVSGVLLVGIPELFTVAAIAVLGKAGFDHLKGLLFRAIRRHVPDAVGVIRYRVGLLMFVLPLVFGFLSPYVGYPIPGHAGSPRAFAVTGDVLLLASVFVLGGDFWDKVRALFIHGAKAVLPGEPSVGAKPRDKGPRATEDIPVRR